MARWAQKKNRILRRNEIALAKRERVGWLQGQIETVCGFSEHFREYPIQ